MSLGANHFAENYNPGHPSSMHESSARICLADAE